MSSPENSGPPINIQKGIISASLNASMLLNSLMGIYTAVYAGTLYLYLSKRSPSITNHRIIISSISALYLLCFLQFLVQWYLLNWTVVVQGDTRASIFFSTFSGDPAWARISVDIPYYLVFIVSDGLLIWRCYHVWGQSFRIILIPLILLMAEFGLFIPTTVLATGQLTDLANARLFDKISSALTCVALASTLLTTFLIGYRIHSVSRSSNRTPSRRLFIRVVVLLTESVAAYSLLLLVNAITTAIPSLNNIWSPWAPVQFYVEAVLAVVAGMAPTVLVARIALTDPNNRAASTNIHISRLDFESQPPRSGRRTNTTREVDTSVHTTDTERTRR